MEFKNKIPQPSLSQISKIQSRHTNLIWNGLRYTQVCCLFLYWFLNSKADINVKIIHTVCYCTNLTILVCVLNSMFKFRVYLILNNNWMSISRCENDNRRIVRNGVFWPPPNRISAFQKNATLNIICQYLSQLWYRNTAYNNIENIDIRLHTGEYIALVTALRDTHSFLTIFETSSWDKLISDVEDSDIWVKHFTPNDFDCQIKYQEKAPQNMYHTELLLRRQIPYHFKN